MKNLCLILLIQFIGGKAFSQVEEVTSCGSIVKKEMQQGGIYDYVDEPAEFPGGTQALRKFLADNLKYPERPLKDSVQGKCYVNLMPRWKPAKVNGKNVSSYYRIPISFK